MLDKIHPYAERAIVDDKTGDKVDAQNGSWINRYVVHLESRNTVRQHIDQLHRQESAVLLSWCYNYFFSAEIRAFNPDTQFGPGVQVFGPKNFVFTNKKMLCAGFVWTLCAHSSVGLIVRWV